MLEMSNMWMLQRVREKSGNLTVPGEWSSCFYSVLIAGLKYKLGVGVTILVGVPQTVREMPGNYTVPKSGHPAPCDASVGEMNPSHIIHRHTAIADSHVPSSSLTNHHVMPSFNMTLVWAISDPLGHPLAGYISQGPSVLFCKLGIHIAPSLFLT